jgi:hypothetical protein
MAQTALKLFNHIEEGVKQAGRDLLFSCKRSYDAIEEPYPFVFPDMSGEGGASTQGAASTQGTSQATQDPPQRGRGRGRGRTRGRMG